MYDKLLIKAIVTGGCVLKTWFNIDKLGLQNKIDEGDKKITDTSGFLKNKIITQKLLR